MTFLDPAVRMVGRRSISLAGSLILEIRRRRRSYAPRRTPDDLLLADGSGVPGPALVEPVADWDMLLLPSEIDGDQVMGLVRAAGKAVLDGAAERLLESARELPRNLRKLPAAVAAARRRRDDDRTSAFAIQPAERAAWDRFLAAHDAVEERRAAFSLSPSDLTAEQLRSAEVELEDAVAVAGELQVRKIRWILA